MYSIMFKLTTYIDISIINLINFFFNISQKWNNFDINMIFDFFEKSLLKLV